MPQLPMLDISPGAFIVDYGVGSGFANLEIQPTLGRSAVRADDQIADIFEEGYGDAPVDAVFKGLVAEIEIPMTRWAIATMADLFPVATTLTGDVLVVKSLVGQAMRENAVAVCIKPLVNNVVSTVDGQWLLFYLCHPVKSWDIGYDREGQRVTTVRFKVFPKMTSNAGDLFQIGVNQTP